MNTDEWRSVIDYWVGSGHDIKYLNIPPDVANELDIELPKEETDMTDETQTDTPIDSGTANAMIVADPPATTEPEDNTIFEWKKKKYFDGTVCGLRGCSKKLHVEGSYISGTKPTKGGGDRLWYGPACSECVTKAHSGMTPDTLAQLAHQRSGASDLALILDCEVGDIHKRLAAAGVDENGQSLGSTVGDGGPPGPVHVSDGDMTSQGELLGPVSPAVIPTEKLATTSQGIQGTLVFLGTFHIQSQQDMDNAGGWLNTVKSQWKDLDEMRKALGKPYRDKATEIQKHFNPVLNTLKQAEGLLKQKMTEGQQRADAAQQAALAAAQAAHAAGDMQAAGQAAQQVAAADVALPRGVTQRPNLVKYEVIDPNQLSREFWSPDPVKIQAALTAGVRQINGVRIWEEPSLQARATS